MTQRLWCVMDLVTDRTTGRLRESACWSNAGKAAIWYAYVKYVNAANFETMTLVLAGALLGHEIGSRILNQRSEKMEKDKNDTVRTS